MREVFGSRPGYRKVEEDLQYHMEVGGGGGGGGGVIQIQKVVREITSGVFVAHVLICCYRVCVCVCYCCT